MMNQASGLNEAIKKTDINKVKEILDSPDCSSFINDEDHQKYTPLFIACMHPNEKFGFQIVQLLIEKGANPLHYDINIQTVLYYLAKDGKLDITKTLLPQYSYDLNHNDYVKQTPLFFAVSENHKEFAEYLLKHKADINHIDENGQNCIFYAASKGHLDMCKLLVNRGANFQIIDNNKETPLIYARKKKNKNIVDYFSGLKNSLRQHEAIKKINVFQGSSQQSLKGQRKKKQPLKQEYCMIFTNEKGQIRQLSIEDIQKFVESNEQNQKLVDLIKNPENLDMMTFPQEKKFQKIAMKIINFFLKHQQGIYFSEPIDIVALNIPHYPNIVKSPMDFSTIKTKLTFNAYDDEKDFYTDMNLVFDNCVLFNGKDSFLGKIAGQLKLEFNTMFRKQYNM